ncbi:hypothetical protein BC629DRAFT_732822 [Irpex lacteus]|nr:hypothetical protein BC629DRAFT_732822 [Irpex lacteus]
MSSSLRCQSTIDSSRSKTMGNVSRVACSSTSWPSSMFDQNMNAQDGPAAKSHRVPRFCIASASCSTRVLTGIDASATVEDTPILTANDVQDETQFWEYDALEQTIKNVKTGLYAFPEDLQDGARILAGTLPFTWDIREQSSGYYTIGLPEDNHLCWNLASDVNYGFVTLQRRHVGCSAWGWRWTKFQSRECSL